MSPADEVPTVTLGNYLPPSATFWYGVLYFPSVSIFLSEKEKNVMSLSCLGSCGSELHSCGTPA